MSRACVYVYKFGWMGCHIIRLDGEGEKITVRAVCNQYHIECVNGKKCPFYRQNSTIFRTHVSKPCTTMPIVLQQRGGGLTTIQSIWIKKDAKATQIIPSSWIVALLYTRSDMTPCTAQDHWNPWNIWKVKRNISITFNWSTLHRFFFVLND